MNDLHEESEETEEEVDGDTYNKMADNTEVQDDDEEKDHIRYMKKIKTISSYENEEDDDDDSRDKIDCVSITLIFIF